MENTSAQVVTGVAADPQSPPSPVAVKIREPRINFFETQRILSVLETKLSTKVMCYYTPPSNDINQAHPDIFLEQLRQLGSHDSISLIVISNGGDSSASFRIASILREYCRKFQVVVPSRCASAATVLSLAADKIIMCPSGFLTAIDTSLTHGLNPKGPDNQPVSVSVDQIKRILRFLNEEGPAVTESQKEGSYRTLFKYLHPLVLGEIDRISSRTILIANKMMKMHPQDFRDDSQIDWIAHHLYNDYPEHGFPILYDEACEIGLPVQKADSDLSYLLRDLVNFYDSTTISAKTHFSETYYHLAGFTNLVESVGMRTIFRSSYDKRINPTTRTWQVENDLSRWVNIIPSTENPSRVNLLPLDIALPSDSKSSDASSRLVAPPCPNTGGEDKTSLT